MPKYERTKAGTLKCKTHVLVDSSKSHPHHTGEVIGKEDLAVVCTVISHFCYFMCTSTKVSEAHSMIFQVNSRDPVVIYEICIVCRTLK